MAGLLNFTACERTGGAQRDVIDWPPASRDGYVLSNVSAVPNSYLVGVLAALGLAEAVGRTDLAARLRGSPRRRPRPCDPPW